MKLFSLSSLALSLGSLCTFASAQQLPSDHYLVGTQGWVDNAVSSALNTIQVISPYTGKATVLKVTGIPTLEAPASFVIQSPSSFLLGTKTTNAALPAAGNVYTVVLQKNNSWLATQLNKQALGINVSDMVVFGPDAYVIGSSVFSNTGNDAQILRISTASGSVNTHLKIGDKFNAVKPTGAFGLGSGLVLEGKTLHAFTFDTTTTTPQQNEHWTVSTTTPVKYKKLPSLPSSKRRIVTNLHAGFGTSGAFLDPKNSKRIVVVGRWGELVWRDLNGKDLQYEAFPGPINFATSGYDELWRGVALNTNTYAFGLGDHNGASIDERRCANSAKAVEPFSNNIAKAIQPAVTGTTIVYTIAGMTYIPGASSYRTMGDGCPDGANGIPCSYASGAPTKGNPVFGFTLHARPKGASPTTTAILLVSGKGKSLNLAPVAPGCMLHVDLLSLALVLPVGSLSNEVTIGPFALPSKPLTAYTQWALFTPKANALNLVFSDARALIIK